MLRYRGQSLLEYALLGVLVLALAIGTLAQLGGGLNVVFSHMLGSSPSQAQDGAVSAAGFDKTSSEPVALSFTSTPVSPLLIPDVITQPQSIQQLTMMVQTTGANGATQTLADSLLHTAGELLAQGEIDESNYSKIVALANQGHRLAEIESAINGAAKQAGNNGGAGFISSQVQLDGKFYSGPDVVRLISNASPDVQNFNNLRNEVLQSITLKDPGQQALISQLSTDILNIANAVATSGDYISQDGGGINSYDSYVEDFPGLMGTYANQTTLKSNTICSQSTSSACQKN